MSKALDESARRGDENRQRPRLDIGALDTIWMNERGGLASAGTALAAYGEVAEGQPPNSASLLLVGVSEPNSSTGRTG